MIKEIFTTENLPTLISIGISILSVIFGTVASVLKYSSSKKAKKIAEILNKVVPEAMIYAEKLGTSGEAKQVLAKAKISVDVLQKGLDFTKLEEQINERIEDEIKLSKEVNVKKGR